MIRCGEQLCRKIILFSPAGYLRKQQQIYKEKKTFMYLIRVSATISILYIYFVVYRFYYVGKYYIEFELTVNIRRLVDIA